MKRISILVVSWNGREHLSHCLPTLVAQRAPGIEVELLLLDNGSSDGSVEFVRNASPAVRVVESPTNLGFAAGNNREEPFDERFPYAAWEDIEASYRMTRRGLRLVYQPSATVAHNHPTDFDRFCLRQERTGYCAVVFWQRHPELGQFVGAGPDGPPPLPPRGRQRLREALVRALQPFPVSTPRLWYEALRFH